VTGSPLDIPTVEVDIVDVEGPTGRARMCCRPKPTDECRQATRESGGPTTHTRPEVEVRWALYLVRKVFDVLQLVSCINRHMYTLV
jgi:hypothetical protein